MTPQTLRTIGEALHGPAWQRLLARDLQITERMIAYYLKSGQKDGRNIPANMPARLTPLLAAKMKTLRAICASLKKEN